MVNVRPVTGGEPPNSFAVTTPDKLKDLQNPKIEDEEKQITENVESGNSVRFRRSVSVFLLLYTLFGAWIFQLLEREPEMETLTLRRKTLASGRVDLIRAMANLTGDPDNLANFQTNENGSAALDAVHDYESVIDSILEGDLRVYLSETEETHLKWESFLQTYFFVLILITTIGYGNLAPTTIWGRIFCINYALIGIPVMLIFITQVGKRLARFSTCVYLRFFGNRTGWRYFTSEKDPSYIQKMMGTSASISTVVIVLFSYMAIGAALFDVTEQWGFINSFYFCFISLTTVGFGDLVPLPIGPGNKWGPVLIILRTIYSLCGLAITATAIQLVQSHYEEIWIKAEVKRSLREKEKMEDIRYGCEDVKLPSVSN